ncbi:hypothetical protein ANOM_007670 [Aspergillus nomiae NRRL 13137]|uniref:Serine hydrolase domain-containing protein n=1 Tax=Aspergillus nomiae NRRL (strain ATCC 15546 / NRRL 13137 / CBS 260.88 / M93) TaxID=1509407 RepID=A0A0L1IW98_ASPN3|nr:uncharacterized protein ANOM_007670 [Aspergillus nomiae NRRL 13137]KNG83685.1 hypothetical protein ANOM_007670 [Aspergillus nomiae NRRL 13137]
MHSDIFEQQTAAIRYELGNQHTYDFVEGVVPWESSIQQVAETNEATFAFCDPQQPQSCRQAVIDFERYIKEEGPFDGIIGFSVGATMALSCLLDWDQTKQGVRSHVTPFKVAVFFSNASQPYDLDALASDHIAYLNSAQIGRVLNMPTAHIWGSADPQAADARRAVEFCDPEKRSVFVHASGHEIPDSVENAVSIAKVINRAISQVEGK